MCETLLDLLVLCVTAPKISVWKPPLHSASPWPEAVSQRGT